MLIQFNGGPLDGVSFEHVHGIDKAVFLGTGREPLHKGVRVVTHAPRGAQHPVRHGMGF